MTGKETVRSRQTQPKSFAVCAEEDVKTVMLATTLMMATCKERYSIIQMNRQGEKLAERPTDVRKIINVAIALCHWTSSTPSRPDLNPAYSGQLYCLLRVPDF